MKATTHTHKDIRKNPPHDEGTQTSLKLNVTHNVNVNPIIGLSIIG